MIKAEGLTKRFENTLAVDGLSLEVAEGEVFGFLGPNGAGKTTTVRMLASLVAPTSGAGVVNGHAIGKDDDAVRASVGVLTETPGHYNRLTAMQNLEFFAELQSVEEPHKPIRRYLEMLGLWERRHDLVGGFSKGMKQKLAIARTLLHEPKVVFLDEPTSGLDPEAARVVRDSIEELKGQKRTIFMCTHNLDEADRLCDRIGFFRQRLLRVASPEALREGLYGRTVVVRLKKLTPELEAVAAKLPFVKAVRAEDGALHVGVADPDEETPELLRALVGAGADVRSVQEKEHSLEQVYFDVLGTRHPGSEKAS